MTTPHPSSAHAERVDQAIADWLEATEEGRSPEPREFIARNPEIAAELTAFFADRQRFARRAEGLAFGASSSGAVPSPVGTGCRLGDFDLVCELGRGGMGVVFLATQRSLQRQVALKVLNPGLGLDERLVVRFEREARAAAMLKHAGIVPIFAVGSDAGVHFYAMERIDGPSLDVVLRGLRRLASDAAKPVARERYDETLDRLLRPPVASGADDTISQPPDDRRRLIFGQAHFDAVARLIADAADALDYAHTQGVTHRDVKPSNLLMGHDGRVRVGDFGLARVAQDPKVTMTGEFVGSPAYMSPEQAGAGKTAVDHRTDVYSLGATLYELLTLRAPFEGQGRNEVLVKVLHAEPALPRSINPRLPCDLETICLKALDKSPDRRYQSCASMARDLRNYLAGIPITARRKGSFARMWNWAARRRALTVAAACLVVALSIAVWSANRARVLEEGFVQARLQDAVDDALIATMSGDIDVAERAIANVGLLEPDTGWLPLLRGHLAVERGEYDEALVHLQQAVELLPESVAARSLLGVAYVGAGWWESYEQALEEIEKLEPETPEDYLFRGLAESYLDPRRARASLDQAIRGRRLPAAYVVRAEVCAHLAMDTADPADADAALSDARLACEMLPDNPAALLVRLFAHHVAAGVYEDVGRADDAEECLELAERDAEALEPFSHLPSVARARAWFYVYTDREVRALEILKDAASRSDNARLAYRYALLLYRRGEFDAGLALLEARQNRSNNEELLRALFLLEQPDGRNRALEAYAALREQSPGGLAALFRPLVLLLAGDTPAAEADSRALRDQPDRLPRLRRAFYERLLAFNGGEIPADELLTAAGSSRWDRCEAQFFIGLRALSASDRDAAKIHFREAVAARCYGFLAWDWSQTLLARLERDASWPAWIPQRDR